MNDLDRQLREYIDAAASPVTLDEVVRPAKQSATWRSRPWMALAAGAAVVLIPAIVIIGIARLTPSETTIGPATSIAPPPTTDRPTSTTTVPSTTLGATTLPPISTVDLVVPAGGIEGEFVVATWQRLREHDRDQIPNLLATFDAPALEGPAVASDRNGGLYLAADGVIEYFAPGSDTPTTLPIHPEANPTVTRSLVWVDFGSMNVLLHVGDTEDDLYGYDVIAEQPWLEGVADSFGSGYLRLQGERFATLTDGDGADLTPETAGTADVWLTVDSEGELFRVKVSTEAERVVRLHDFDGRRVLLSRQAAEPVGSNATYILIDTECARSLGCVLAMVDQPGTAALTRRVLSEGPVERDRVDLGTCSAQGTSPDVITDAPSLPETVQLTRGRMLRLAAACNMADLHLLAVDSGTRLLQSNAYVDGIIGGELAGFPTLATIVALFQEAPAVTADGTYVWPAIASPEIDWQNLSEEAEAALIAEYGEALVFDSKEFGLFPGLRLEIDPDGTWTFYGRPIS
ncbi:MAG: hypothetical protein HKN91_03025 [Acidimicrobiia bacterium]|nr:hypothetical protein [Acidimicrobiia bacterium]